MFYTWEVTGHPLHLYSPIHLYAPYICMPPRGVDIPICHPYSFVHLYVLRGFCMLWRVVRGPLHVGHLPYTSPCMGCPPYVLHPPLISWLPCASVCFGDICMWYGEYFPYVGSIGVFPHVLGVLGESAHGVSICFLNILIVHYVSHFYYGYDYYSSSYSGVLWAVICFISDHGSFPDKASCNIGSVWSGSTTTLDAVRLWRCYWPCLCAAAATSIFNASSVLCQFCYVCSPQVDFFFRVEPPNILYIICLVSILVSAFYFGVHSGVCFLLSGAKLDALFTYGGSTIRVCTFATLWSSPMAGICATWWLSSVHGWYA